MSSAIFTPPAGLLGLLGSKAVSQTPATLLETVAAVLDCSTFFLAGAGIQNLNVVSATVTAPGILTNGFVVPSGKLWIPVMQVCAVQSIGAGDSGRGRPAVTDSTQTTLYYTGNNGSILASSGATSIPSTSVDWWQHPTAFDARFAFTVYMDTAVTAITGVTVYHSLSYVEVNA